MPALQLLIFNRSSLDLPPNLALAPNVCSLTLIPKLLHSLYRRHGSLTQVNASLQLMLSPAAGCILYLPLPLETFAVWPRAFRIQKQLDAPSRRASLFSPPPVQAFLKEHANKYAASVDEPRDRRATFQGMVRAAPETGQKTNRWNWKLSACRFSISVPNPGTSGLNTAQISCVRPSVKGDRGGIN